MKAGAGFTLPGGSGRGRGEERGRGGGCGKTAGDDGKLKEGKADRFRLTDRVLLLFNVQPRSVHVHVRTTKIRSRPCSPATDGTLKGCSLES